MIILYLLLGLSIYRGIITWKFYEAAGRKAWEAFVPFWNVYLMLKISNRPKWWILIYYIPVVDNIMAIVMTYEFLHVYKFREIRYSFLSVITLGLYLGYLNYTEPIKYYGRDEKYIKGQINSTVNSIFFAVIAATIIRSTTFEAYTIPTSSMEKSLMVGDFLFVSKMHYGVRIPMTPLSIPLIHNFIPGTMTPSYSTIIELPYLRLPAIEVIEKGDPVVFNYPGWPEGFQPSPHVEKEAWNLFTPPIEPIDKRNNYVKRCVAVAGDTLQIINQDVFINGDKFEWPDRANGQTKYWVIMKPGQTLNATYLKKTYDINFLQSRKVVNTQDVSDANLVSEITNADGSRSYVFEVNVPNNSIEQFKREGFIQQIIPIVIPAPGQPVPELPGDLSDKLKRMPFDFPVYPNPIGTSIDTLVYKWSIDNYGPLYIPKAGITVPMNFDSYLRYGRIISIYEGHTLERNGDQYIIDGQVADSYTFQQNYYWMQGDNRHNSFDCRFWGFVPEDHIVGKPVFIWMSLDSYSSGLDKIRTERVFTTVNGVGERVSYFWYFLTVVVLYNVVAYFRKNKKEQNKK